MENEQTGQFMQGPSLELVVHCWSGDEVPIYHTLLSLQLSSLWIYTPTVPVTYTLYFAEDDRRTIDTLNRILPFFANYPNVVLNLKPNKARAIKRRSIKRHEAALNTKADVVWFADVDYLFIKDSIGQAARKCWMSSCDMIFPRLVMTHKLHRYGDELIEYAETKRMMMSVDKRFFEPVRQTKAIGGIQIVKGDRCRQSGYVHRKIGLREVEDNKRFMKCRGDESFRSTFSDIESVDIEGIYRVRHSFCGRDGKEVDHSL